MPFLLCRFISSDSCFILCATFLCFLSPCCSYFYFVSETFFFFISPASPSLTLSLALSLLYHVSVQIFFPLLPLFLTFSLLFQMISQPCIWHNFLWSLIHVLSRSLDLKLLYSLDFSTFPSFMCVLFLCSPFFYFHRVFVSHPRRSFVQLSHSSFFPACYVFASYFILIRCPFNPPFSVTLTLFSLLLCA